MTKKKNAATPPATISVQDIDHEVVNPETNGQNLPAVIPLEDRIRLEVAKFNLADYKIEELKAAYGPLTISGPDDREGYNKVKAAWNDVRSKRTGIEKKGLSLRSDYNAINKAISGEEDRLIDLLSPLERELQAKWKKIDDDKEAEKRRAEKEAADRLLARVTELVQLGAVQVEGGYQLGDTVSVDVATLGAWSEERYQQFMGAAKKKAAEIERAKEEANRKAREEAAEQERQRMEFQRQQAELKQQQEVLERQQAEMEKQLKIMREAQLAAIGMVDAGDRYLYRDEYNKLEIMKGLALQMNAEQWGEYLKSATAAVNQYKLELEKKLAEQEQERKRIAERKDKVASSMQEAGLWYSYPDEIFWFKNDFADLKFTMEALINFNDVELDSEMQAARELVQKAINDQAVSEKDKQRKKEEERLATLSDEQKLVEYLQALLAVPIPTFATATATDVVNTFTTEIKNLLTEYHGH